MNKDQKEGIKEQLKGVADKAIGTVTRNDDRKAKGDVEIINGENRQEYGKQKKAIEKGDKEPGETTNE
ncbi:hypothetical protein BHUM_06223 [Candidatus Burkholderia humilis]|nr:hypothetical protein BHUM_06223 [Candidatus Burkholderia humilis]